MMAALVSALVLSLFACAHHMRPLQSNAMLTIPAHATQGVSPQQAVARTLTLAARATLDHGYRYFVIVGSSGQSQAIHAIRPGVPVAIRLYQDGEIDPVRAGAFDASEIVMKGPPSS
jgi:hypothetical protein